MRRFDLPYIIAGMLAGKRYACAFCLKEIKGFKDRDSAREFRVSGSYQDCQDRMFTGTESTY